MYTVVLRECLKVYMVKGVTLICKGLFILDANASI